MIGIVDVGGGLRDVYGAAIFDRCIEEGVSFDVLVGVSAGSGNIASFLAGQKGRNYRFYTDYCFRKEYMSVGNFLKTGSYLDLEYIYGEAMTNSGGEDPLDYAAMIASGKTFIIVATDAMTGRAAYFRMEDMEEDDYGAIKGGANVPGLDQPYAWKGGKYYDGGISDPIPYRKALAEGCDRVVVILTRPKDYRRNPKNDRRMAAFMRKYPNAGRALAHRAKVYNRQLESVLRYEELGQMLVLAPDDIGGMSTLTKDKEEIMKMYDKGKRDAEKLFAWL